jgi:hypothetical protein
MGGTAEQAVALRRVAVQPQQRSQPRRGQPFGWHGGRPAKCHSGVGGGDALAQPATTCRQDHGDRARSGDDLGPPQPPEATRCATTTRCSAASHGSGGWPGGAAADGQGSGVEAADYGEGSECTSERESRCSRRGGEADRREGCERRGPGSRCDREADGGSSTGREPGSRTGTAVHGRACERVGLAPADRPASVLRSVWGGNANSADERGPGFARGSADEDDGSCASACGGPSAWGRWCVSIWGPAVTWPWGQVSECRWSESRAVTDRDPP